MGRNQPGLTGNSLNPSKWEVEAEGLRNVLDYTASLI